MKFKNFFYLKRKATHWFFASLCHCHCYIVQNSSSVETFLSLESKQTLFGITKKKQTFQFNYRQSKNTNSEQMQKAVLLRKEIASQIKYYKNRN